MKEKIVYGLIFTLLFAIVSAGMIYFNSKYKNIFAFDFSPRINKEQLNKDLAKADTLKTDTLKTDILNIDSLKTNSLKVDSLKADKNTLKTNELKNNEKIVASTELKNKNIPQVTNTVLTTEVPFRLPASDKTKTKKDSIYKEWVKQTVKLYESMDSKKAAKVIINYSDNIARDILLKMKKKKAAEILAELKPEVVSRIISVN
ncbi:MAG: hypothetical protein ACOYU5_04720 [Stygiobacter sp.]